MKKLEHFQINIYDRSSLKDSYLDKLVAFEELIQSLPESLTGSRSIGIDNIYEQIDSHIPMTWFNHFINTLHNQQDNQIFPLKKFLIDNSLLSSDEEERMILNLVEGNDIDGVEFSTIYDISEIFEPFFNLVGFIKPHNVNNKIHLNLEEYYKDALITIFLQRDIFTTSVPFMTSMEKTTYITFNYKYPTLSDFLRFFKEATNEMGNHIKGSHIVTIPGEEHLVPLSIHPTVYNNITLIIEMIENIDNHRLISEWIELNEDNLTTDLVKNIRSFGSAWIYSGDIEHSPCVFQTGTNATTVPNTIRLIKVLTNILVNIEL